VGGVRKVGHEGMDGRTEPAAAPFVKPTADIFVGEGSGETKSLL
jgi:hypothetical protein